MDPTHTLEHHEWWTVVGSCLHLPVLSVKTARNRGGHSDRLLWCSLVNSYWTPSSSSSPYPVRPPTILLREPALMASFIPSLWRELMCRVPPPLPFPYQPPIGISQCCPQPPLLVLISISIWSVHWTLTPHGWGLLHFLVVGSAESCSSGINKATHSLTVNFDTYTVTCCLLRHYSLHASGGEIIGKLAVWHFCKCSRYRMHF